MKNKIPLYPFLLALYPILTLYSRNPGEIPGATVIRPAVMALLVTAFIIGLLVIFFKNKYKAYFIAALIVFYFSSSGHVYRILKGYLFPDQKIQLHPVLILLEISLIILLANKNVWEKYFPQKRIMTLTGYVNIFAIVLLIYPALVIFEFAINSGWNLIASRNEFIPTDNYQPKLTAKVKPDIYLLVLDGYGREDVLAELYSTDNSPFIGELKERGFFVAENSHSNYLQTPLSFSSFLNFSYINTATGIMGTKSTNRLPLFDLIEYSRAIVLLKELGYKLITTESGFQFTEFEDSDTILSPFSTSLNTFERFFLSTTALDAFSEINEPFSHILQDKLAIPSYSTHRANVLFSFEVLRNSIPKMESPKFVIVHIVSPHPPFVLNQSGNPIVPNRPYMPGDGEAFGGNSKEYQRQYAEQVGFANGEVLAAIDSILANSNTPPIIILQGDHGPGSLLRRDNINNTCLWERSSILNAYYLPGGNSSTLYPEITPVNTFRVIFNLYFGTAYEMLPDKTYFSPQAYPYDFADITALVNNNCTNNP